MVYILSNFIMLIGFSKLFKESKISIYTYTYSFRMFRIFGLDKLPECIVIVQSYIELLIRL